MTKRIPSYHLLLSLSLLMVIVFSVLTVVVDVGEDLNDDEQKASSVGPSESEGESVSFKNINISDGFSTFESISERYPVLVVTDRCLNKTLCDEQLSRLRFDAHQEAVSVDTKGGSFIYRFSDSTVVIRSDGYLEYRKEDLIYSPTTLDEIFMNDSLVNRSSAYKIGMEFLDDHNIGTDSWTLYRNTTITRQHMNGSKEVVEYFFKLYPEYNDLTIIDSCAPSITLRVDPLGEIIQLRFRNPKVSISSKGITMKFVDPVQCLKHFDDNIEDYTRSRDVEVHGVDLCYREDPSNKGELIPTWLIYLDADLESRVYMEAI